MLIKKKLLYIAVNEISTKAFAVHNWVCGQGVGERPNQEVHPGHTINLSPNEQHLVLIKRTSGYPEINMFTPSGWNWLLLALVGGEGRLYEKSNSHPCSGWADKFFYVLQCCPMPRYDCHFWPIYWFPSYPTKELVPFTQLVKVRRGKLVLALPSIRLSWNFYQIISGTKDE